MGASICVQGFSSKDNPDFQKHFKAVKFCIENDLSYPKETVEFFKGKIDGDNLDDFSRDYIVDRIKEGVPVELKFENSGDNYYEKRIKVSEIPEGTDIIIVKFC
jgi:hypothetical protein